MARLRNHPGFWMRDDAEASLARWEADHGIISVNSAGRTVAEQQHLINRWNQGGTYNRPPYLYEPKRPASASSHVANGGIAFDTSEHARFRRTSADYGWWQPYDWDVVHFEYDPNRDAKKNEDFMSAEAEKQINSIFNAIFRGGDSMPDNKRSIGASLAGITKVVDRIDDAVKPIIRGGVPVSVRQEIADTKTKVIALEAAVEALALSQGADPAAILKAVQDGVEAAMRNVTFTADVGE